MSLKFLTGIDLSGCEILNAVVQNLATAPSSPVDGFMYYDTTLKKYRGYSNSTWFEFGSGNVIDSYTKTETDTAIATAIATLVNGSPEALNTLKELSDALGADPNFATTLATSIGNKVDKVDGKGLSTNDLTDELVTKINAAPTGASKYSALVGDGSSTQIAVTHSLGTKDVTVTLAEATSPFNIVMTDIQLTTIDSITLFFASAPSSGQYRITIIA